MQDPCASVLGGGAEPDGVTARARRPSATPAKTVARRLEPLSESARTVLPMAAALNPTVDVPELAAVLRIPIVDAWSAATEAIEAGLLVRVDGELEFRHDRIRRVLAEQLPASLRADLLGRAGRTLRSTGAPAERIAYYLAESGRELDEGGADWVLRVADELILRAPELALRLSGRIAHLDGARRAALTRLRIRALLRNGRADEAESLVREELRVHGREDTVELRRLAQACREVRRL